MNDERREQRPTAYVLGEMTEEERAAFEAEMEQDAALRAEVDEIREMAALLSREMATGHASLPADAKARIEAAAGGEAGPNAISAGEADPKVAGVAAAEDGSGAGGTENKVVALPKTKKPLLRRVSVWLAAAAVLAAAPALMLTARMQTSRDAPSAVAYAPGRKADEAPRPVAQATVSPAPQAMGLAAPRTAATMNAADADLFIGGKEQGFRAPSGGRFDQVPENAFAKPSEAPLSTFSIDVDTASYSLVRTFLSRGNLPPAGAVRIEEMVNYFGYDYPEPEGGVPFRVQLDRAAAPWAPEHQLVRVGLKGKTVQLSAMDGVNLVFLVDTSGSMSQANKLPLLQQSFRLLVNKLGPNDRVAIVAYAGSAGLVLPSTPIRDKDAVLSAIDRLSSGGSTNGGAGIELAYKVASAHFLRGGVNRVLLATDGDFNVGATSNEALVELIQEKAKTGVFLSVLGFGMGNINDSLLEKIADKGNGQYAYIDNETEAKRALVDGLGGLVTIAKDVKIQVEFDPKRVQGYRLIGYENRTMAARDFHDDKKDAGELGSGHTVTALYEIVPAAGAGAGDLLTVKLRYKEPDGTESKLIEQSLKDRAKEPGQLSGDFRFAAAVASFGMLLRKSPHAGKATYQSVLDLAEPAAGADPKRRELVDLVRKAQAAADRVPPGK